MIRKKILLSDDPELMQALEDSFFGRNGFTLLVAGSEQQAIEIIGEQDPALAILDLDMPGLNGDVCCRRVKGDPILRTTPIILVVRFDREQDLARCREASCDAIIHKPIDSQKLLAAACKLLNIVERKAPRKDVRLPLLCGSDPRKLRPGRMLNLNACGAFIETEKLSPVDTLVTLEFTPPGRSIPIRCKSRVAWVNHPEWVKASQLPAGMGVQFLDLSAEAVAALQRHFEEEVYVAAEEQGG